MKSVPMKILKFVGIGLAGLIALLAIAVIGFFAFFPKELAAREAERRIEEATGRELTLGDNIEVSFWPALGFSVDQASLSNPRGFDGDQPFIAADRIVFAVEAWPLLAGSVRVRQLIFDHARLNLEAKPDGAANWAFPTEASAPDQQSTIEDLRLDDVRLIDSFISFTGGDGAAPMILEHVDASLALDSLDTPAQLAAAADYRGQRVTIESEIGAPRAVLEKGQTPLAARLASGPLNATLDGAFNAADGALTGQLEASGASLRRLLAWMGSPMEGGASTFGRFNVSAQMAHAGEQTALSDATLTLDAISARGNLAILMPEGAKPRIEGALSIANLDLNPYLPAPAQTGQEGVDVDTAWSNDPIDLSGLNALDANLNLAVNALKFQRMDFANVALNLRVANGAADARLSRISLYGGGGAARLIADGSGAIARVAVELNAQNIQAEPLLRDAIGFEKIAGRGRLTASLVGQGRSQAAIMRSLAGSAGFNFNDGQWKGVNLAQMARTVQAALTGETASGGGATDFAELSSSFRFANGVAATNDMRLLNPFVRLEGTGVIDVGGQSIDMRIAPRAVRSIEGQGGNASMAGLGVPFRVHGPWANARFAPALGDVVQNQLRARAQEILGRQDQANPLTQLGESLFGRQAPAAETPAAPAASGAAPAPQAGQQPQTPAPRPEDRARDALGGLLRNAIGGNQEKEKQAAPTE